MNKKIDRQFTSELSQIGLVRQFIRTCCYGIFSEEAGTQIDLVVLAVNEAFNNIVVHGYNGEPGREIRIQSEIKDNGITFELSDRGSSFDVESIPEPNFDGTRENGYGIYIMKEVIDDIIYTKKQSGSDWNRLKLVKKL